MENSLSYTNARLEVIERDVSEIKRDSVKRIEFEDLMARVKYLEVRAGVVSGK